MAPVTNEREQPMLSGVFNPVADEIDIESAEVSGTLPQGLLGTFIRNGPNPMFEPRGRYHMFDGDGMLHAFTFDEGRVSYRNRWIRTPGLLAEMRAGRSLYGGLGEFIFPDASEVGDAGPVKNPANTHIIRHAGRYFALYEGSQPIEVTGSLETVGPHDFDGRLTSPFSAHPKLDPRTGEMLSFAYLPVPPYLTYYEVDSKGALARSVDIELPEAVVIHDFVITDEHVVFMDSPMIYDIMTGLRGGDMFRWDPGHGTRVGVMPRDGSEVTWYETDIGYVNHYWNGWSDGDTVEFSGVNRLDWAYTTGKDGGADFEGADADPGMPTRFTVDLSAGKVRVEQFDDLGGELPRINDDYCGVRSNYLYMGGFRGEATAVGQFDLIVKYDDRTGERTEWYCGPGSAAGEPVFAPDPDGTAEDDGWLLSCVYDKTTDTSDLTVLDARDVGAGPVARVHIGRRMPMGFHANWFPAET